MISTVSYKAESQTSKLSIRNTFRSPVLEKKTEIDHLPLCRNEIQNLCQENGSFMPKIQGKKNYRYVLDS